MGKTNNFPKKAVILAGGKGTRLYPVTREIPKPLLPVKRKPIINYLVDLFYSQGIKDIAVLISKDFREEFDWWRRRYYPSGTSGQAPSDFSGQVPKIKLVEETKPLGTFGGLCFLKDWLFPPLSGQANPFFLTNGDELKKIDLNEMNEFHQKLKTPATIALVKVQDPQHYGVVICKNGKVEQFLEKPKNPPSKYINSGLYLLSPEILNYLPRRGKAGHPGPKFLMIEKDIFPRLTKEKKLAGFKFNGFWMDCGTFIRYEQALKKWR